MDQDLSLISLDASGKTSLNDSHKGSLPRHTITDAISSGLWNLCSCLRAGDATPGIELVSYTKSDFGSALNTQYDLPKGSVPMGRDFPHVNAASRVMFER